CMCKLRFGRLDSGLCCLDLRFRSLVRLHGVVIFLLRDSFLFCEWTILVYIQLRLTLVRFSLGHLRLCLRQLTVRRRKLCLRLCDLRCSLLELSLKLRDLPVRLIYGCLEWSWVDLKQELTFLNKRALFEILSQQITSHLRFDFCVHHSVRRANPLFINRHIALLDRNHFHFERARRRFRWFARPGETQQRRHYQDRYDRQRNSKYFVFC